jgi:hypothetical protein
MEEKTQEQKNQEAKEQAAKHFSAKPNNGQKKQCHDCDGWYYPNLREDRLCPRCN